MNRKTASKRNSTPAELREVIPPIPDTPENIGRASMRIPLKKHWRCLEEAVSRLTDGRGGELSI